MPFRYPEQNFAKYASVRADPLIKNLLGRISSENRDSFTDDQLLSLKLALSGRKWGQHTLDVRGVVRFWRWRYYYVLIGGRETRTLSRREKRMTRTAYALFVLSFFTFSTLLGLATLYILKSAMGVNLIPEYSLGLWGWLMK